MYDELCTLCIRLCKCAVPVSVIQNTKYYSTNYYLYVVLLLLYSSTIVLEFVIFDKIRLGFTILTSAHTSQY